MAENTLLKRLRTELYPPISQEEMARASRVTYVTYRRVENGGKTTYSTAQAVLKALNGYRCVQSTPLAEIEESEIPKLFNLA